MQLQWPPLGPLKTQKRGTMTKRKTYQNSTKSIGTSSPKKVQSIYLPKEKTTTKSNLWKTSQNSLTLKYTRCHTNKSPSYKNGSMKNWKKVSSDHLNHHIHLQLSSSKRKTRTTEWFRITGH